MTRDEVQQNQQDTMSASDKVHYDNRVCGSCGELLVLGCIYHKADGVDRVLYVHTSPDAYERCTTPYASAQSPTEQSHAINPHTSPISPSHANQSTLHAYQGDAGDEC